MANNWREAVTTEIIKKIEQGTAPWQKPYKAGQYFDQNHNALTDKSYQGINELWLEAQGFSDPRWLTMKQANDLGLSIKKGSRATKVEYWKWTDRQALIDDQGKAIVNDDGKPQTQEVKLDRPKVFYANVFNGEQIEGMPALEPRIPAQGFAIIENAESLLSQSGVTIHHDQNDRNFYKPHSDEIHLVPIDAFHSPEDYYATALHEVGHATGHEKRLAREFGLKGTEKYAIEELRAEMVSYMVAKKHGLGHDPERHASYLDSWVKVLKEDPNILFTVSKDAEKAMQWISEPELRPELEKRAQLTKENQSLRPSREVTMSTPKERTYLNVPFAEKDEAKKLGARWDRDQKSWYAEPNSKAVESKRWSKQSDKAIIPDPPQKAFGDFLRSHGIELTGEPVMNGEWQRVKLTSDKGQEQNASYRGFVDGRANGQLTNFKGKSHKWVSNMPKLTPEAKAELEKAAKQAKQDREADLQAKQAKGAELAQSKFDKAQALSGSHEYLDKRGVKDHGLKVDDKGNLLIPARSIEGAIQSVQTIYKNTGAKRFQRDAAKRGGMFVIDPESKLNNTNEPVILSEGYATGATVFEATQKPVIVCFDSSNLKSVAKAVRGQYPDKSIIIASDNDHHLEADTELGNVGVKKAQEAAKAVGGKVIMPKLTPEEKAAKLTDFNDIANARDIKAVSNQFSPLLREKTKGIAKKQSPQHQPRKQAADNHLSM